MKRTVIVLIGMLFILIPSCAMAMESGYGDTEEMEPGCGNEEDFGYEQENWIGGTCPSQLSPSITGAKASWKLTCSGSNVTINGWVKDTLPDGRCARVKIICGSGDASFSPKACGSGTKKNFKKTCSGRMIDAYLQVVK